MKRVYEEAVKLSKEGQEFVLATVVGTKGSTPQKPGATLLVRADGSTVGTLGGGCVEGDIWFAAKEALRERIGAFHKEYYLNEDIAARDGLVCGGSMYFYIDPVLTPADFTGLAAEINRAYEGGPSLAVATVIESKRLPVGARLVVREDGSTTGTLGDAELDSQAMAAARDVMPMGKNTRVTTRDRDDIYVEGYTAPASLVLVGGGHVNLQVAKVAQLLGFRIMVTDDRREFANKDRFPMAEEVSVASYDRGLDAFPITPNTAIVIGSRGHHFDDLALEAAVRTPASYVGLLGSQRKTILIYQSLLKKGIPLERLKQVRAPVGLDIGGRSPEEIAVSIMSEIVAFRHGRPGGPMKMDDAQIDKIAARLQKAAAQGV